MIPGVAGKGLWRNFLKSIDDGSMPHHNWVAQKKWNLLNYSVVIR